MIKDYILLQLEQDDEERTSGGSGYTATGGPSQNTDVTYDGKNGNGTTSAFNGTQNVLNLAGMNARQRKDVRRGIKAGGTAYYYDPSTNSVQSLGNMSRTKMRLTGYQTNKAMRAWNLGVTPSVSNELGEKVRQAMIASPNARYYGPATSASAGASGAGTAGTSGASAGASGAAGASSTVTATTPYTEKFSRTFSVGRQGLTPTVYTMNWTGTSPALNQSTLWRLGNLANGMGANFGETVTGVLPTLAGSDTDITMDEFMTWLNNQWKGNGTTTGWGGAGATDLFSGTDYSGISNDQWNSILNGMITNGFISTGFRYQAKGGNIYKLQDGGEVLSKLKKLVKAAKAGIKEAAQTIAKIKEAAKSDIKYRAIAQAISLLEQQDQSTENAQSYTNDTSDEEALYALQGAKLHYIQRLRNKCPEGFELKMFKAGGQICTKCMRKIDVRNDNLGGESDVIKAFKNRKGGRVK